MQNERTRRDFLKAAGTSALAVSVGGLALLKSDPASAQSIQRPISDFINAQGAETNFWPPVPDYVGWTVTGQPQFALVDYAGVAYRWILANGGPDLGTTLSGSVMERPLKDGRAEVAVLLHATNALTLASLIQDIIDFPNPADRRLLFGNLAPDVANGATPALGESHLHLVFTNTAPGAPLPDMVAAFIIGPTPDGVELRQISFRSNSTGPLKAAAGLGPDGTPGRCIVSQTGLFMTSFRGATADGFPAELVNLRKIGS